MCLRDFLNSGRIDDAVVRRVLFIPLQLLFLTLNKCSLRLPDPRPFTRKITNSSLPQLTLMELFVNGVADAELVWGGREDSWGLPKWLSVELDAHHVVVHITRSVMDLQAS